MPVLDFARESWLGGTGTDCAMHRASRTRLPWPSTGLVFAAGLALFLAIAFRTDSDIPLHAEFIRDATRVFFVPIDFLYYYSVALLSLFSPDHERILIASAVVLALALAGKYLVTAMALSEELPKDTADSVRSRRWMLLACLGLMLVFCLPIPGMNWYLGQFPPNQWHNSTTIMVMPFAILLFFSSAAFLETGDRKHLRPIVLLTLANAITKPSLLFVFGPVFPLAALLRFGWRRNFFLACLPAVAVAAISVSYYLMVFQNPEYRSMEMDASGSVATGWFIPWLDYSANIPLSILNSLLLPLLFLLLYPRECLSDLRIRYASGMLAVGLIIFSFFHETGERSLHGNLLWQNIIVNYVLHFSVVLCFVRIKRRSTGLRAADALLIAFFVLQALAGLVYLGRFVVSGTYV